MSCFFYVSDYRPFLRDYSRKAQWRSVPWLRQAMSARVAPTKGDSFGVVLSGNRGEPGLQFLPNIGVCVAMERKPGKCMLLILVIGIPERTQSTLRHRLWQRERVPSLEVDVFVDQG